MRFVPPVRRLVQGAFALFCLVVGYRFYHFFLWATGDGAFVSRPASVEAFLPVGALVSFKKLLLTGHYDRLHPAGLTIFMAALAIALLFRKGFCGWICPIGFLFDLQEAVVARFRRPLRLPGWLDYPLRSLKYLLLGAFLYLIGWQMDLQAIDGFMRSPYNVMVDARMLGFFLHPSAMAIGFFIFLFAAAMVLRNFWCRFLCPYGGLLGLMASFSPLQVKRDGSSCIDCRRCEKVCPGAIRITAKEVVRSPECVGCLECVVVCPVQDCLTLSLAGRKKMPLFLLPVGVVALLLTFYLVAKLSGHWESAIPVELFKKMYGLSLRTGH